MLNFEEILRRACREAEKKSNKRKADLPLDVLGELEREAIANQIARLFKS